MHACFFHRAILVAAIAGLLSAGHGLGFTSQAGAQSIKVGTLNLRIAGDVRAGQTPRPGGWDIDNWETTRRYLVEDAILASQPDIMGFQEAFARNNGTTQQTLFGQLFAPINPDSNYEYLSWEEENVLNMNPIIVNTDRFTIVDSGTTTVDYRVFLDPGFDPQNPTPTPNWDRYHELHALFHGDERDDGSIFVHFLGPERYTNWVVVDDKLTGGRIAFLTSHYETFIGRNGFLGEVDEHTDEFVEFTDTVNASFGYNSEQLDAQAEELRALYGDLGVVIGGDFETGDSELPAQKAYEDAGYDETWRFINGPNRRPLQGIDTLWVKTADFTIDGSVYDPSSNYTNPDGTIQASDHDPLYAVLTQTVVPEPSGLVLVALGLTGAAFSTWRRRPSANGARR